MGNFGLYDLGIVVVVVLGIGGYQLWSVSRDVAKDRARKAAPSGRAGHPVREHPLDDAAREQIEVERLVDRGNVGTEQPRA